jgi:hypothetical protein
MQPLVPQSVGVEVLPDVLSDQAGGVSSPCRKSVSELPHHTLELRAPRNGCDAPSGRDMKPVPVNERIQLLDPRLFARF